jgi:hypothetical protein
MEGTEAPWGSWMMVGSRSVERKQIHVKTSTTRSPDVGEPWSGIKEGPKGEQA